MKIISFTIILFLYTFQPLLAEKLDFQFRVRGFFSEFAQLDSGTIDGEPVKGLDQSESSGYGVNLIYRGIGIGYSQNNSKVYWSRDTSSDVSPSVSSLDEEEWNSKFVDFSFNWGEQFLVSLGGGYLFEGKAQYYYGNPTLLRGHLKSQKASGRATFIEMGMSFYQFTALLGYRVSKIQFDYLDQYERVVENRVTRHSRQLTLTIGAMF